MLPSEKSLLRSCCERWLVSGGDSAAPPLPRPWIRLEPACRLCAPAEVGAGGCERCEPGWVVVLVLGAQAMGGRHTSTRDWWLEDWVGALQRRRSDADPSVCLVGAEARRGEPAVSCLCWDPDARSNPDGIPLADAPLGFE